MRERENPALARFVRRHRSRLAWRRFADEAQAAEVVDRVLDRLGAEPDTPPETRLRALLATGLHTSMSVRHLEWLGSPPSGGPLPLRGWAAPRPRGPGEPSARPEKEAGGGAAELGSICQQLCDTETVLSACEELAVMFARGREGEFSAVVSRVAGGDDGHLLSALSRCFENVQALLDHELLLREARGVLLADRDRLIECVTRMED